MADIGFDFDSSQVEPSRPYEPLPAGDYVMHIIESNIRTSETSGNTFVELRLEVMEGDQTGRQHIERLNLWHGNQTVVDIAQRTLSAICRAVGVGTVRDTELLHFRPMRVKVSVTKRKDNGEWQNRLAFLPEGEAPAAPRPAAPAVRPAPAATPAARPASTAPTAGAAKPWQRSKPAA